MKYLNNMVDIIKRSIDTIEEDKFDALLEDSVRTLKDGKKIIVSGLGKNVPICDKFVGTMNSLGLEASFLNTNSAVHGDLGIVRDGDLLIILTKSGETVESVYLTEQVMKRDVTLWLLTFERDSVLARTIPNSLVLELEHEGDMWNIVPNNSTTINLLVLQALAMQIAEKMELTLEDFKRNHPGGHIGVVLQGE